MSIFKKRSVHDKYDEDRFFIPPPTADLRAGSALSDKDETGDADQSANLVFKRNTKPAPADERLSYDTVEYNIPSTAESNAAILGDTHIVELASDEEYKNIVITPAHDTNGDKSAIFENSVKKFHINTSAVSKGARQRRFNALLMNSAMLALCVGVFLYCTYLVVVRTIETNAAESEYDSIRVDALAESFIKKTSKLKEPDGMLTMFQMLSSKGEQSDDISDDITVDELAQMKSYYKNYILLKGRYPQMFGWIVLTGTKIDYPLMFDPNDNYYYLNHSYSGQPSRSGSCYADASTNTDYLSNYNLVTYGHSMQNGTMYRGIKLWYDSSTRDADAENMRIYVYTADGLYIYEIFSSYRSTDSSSYARMSFGSADDYRMWLNTIYNKSSLKKTCEYSSDSRIITMITCSNVSGNPNERYILHGKLIDTIPASQLLN